MKKLLSLMAIMCCVALLFCFPVRADATNDVIFEVDAIGDTITVDVASDFACGAVQGMLSYDGSAIAYEGASFAGGLSSINSANNSFSDSSGSTKVALVCAASGGVNGDLATLTYTADAGVPALFEFGALKAFDASGAKLSNANAIIVMYGDTDGDGLLNILDLVRLKKTAANSNTVVSTYEAFSRNYDLDKNGVLAGADDITALIAKLLR